MANYFYINKNKQEVVWVDKQGENLFCCKQIPFSTVLDVVEKVRGESVERFFATLKDWGGPAFVTADDFAASDPDCTYLCNGLVKETTELLMNIILKAVPYNNVLFVDFANKMVKIMRLAYKSDAVWVIYRQNASFSEIVNVVDKSPADETLLIRLEYGKEFWANPCTNKIDNNFIDAYEELFSEGAYFIGTDSDFCTKLREFCKNI